MDFLLIGFLGIITLLAIISCTIRGRNRSLVRLVFILISGALALYLTPRIAGFSGMAELLWDLGETSVPAQLAGAGPTLSLVVRGASSAVWAVLLFPIVFFLLCLLMTIPVSIINRKTERKHRGAGALIGVLVGVLSFSIAFAPLCAAGSMALDSVKTDRLLQAEAIPGEPMLDYLTTVSADEQSVSLSRELGPLLPLYMEYKADPDNISEILPKLADCVEESEFLQKAVDELQTAAKKHWGNGEEFLGYNPLETANALEAYVIKAICATEKNLPPDQLFELLELIYR